MTGSELFVPVRNTFSGKKSDFKELDRNLKRCFQAIEDWADSPFVSSAHIQDAAITNAHIADATIDAAKITNLSADKITSGTLNAEVLLAGKMRTGDPGARRVELDEAGVRLLDETDATVVNLPTDVDQAAYFAGTIVASDLQLTGSATVSDQLVVDVAGGEVNIRASFADPATPPAINSSGAPSIPFNVGNADTTSAGRSPQYARHGLWLNGSDYYYWYFDASSSTSNLHTVVVGSTGTEIVDDTVALGSGSQFVKSAVYIASTGLWYLYRAFYGDLIITGSDTVSGKVVPSTGIISGQTIGTGASQAAGMLATDGTFLYYADPIANGNIVVYKYSVSTTTASLVSSTTCVTGRPAANWHSIHAFYVGSGDFGAVRYVFQVRDVSFSEAGVGGSNFYVFNTSGTRQASQEWTSSSWGGLVYRDGAFRELSPDSEVLYTHGPATGAFANSTYWVAYTWYDADATGGTHESGLSPRTPFTGGTRSQLQVTWPTIPDSGGTDDPNTVRVYLKQATTDPGAAFGSYFRQGSTYADTTTTLTTYDTGTAGTQDTAFPNSGTPGQITTGLGGFEVRGDGTLILPVFAADPSGGVEGQVYFNSVTNKFTGHDGTSWVALH